MEPTHCVGLKGYRCPLRRNKGDGQFRKGYTLCKIDGNEVALCPKCACVLTWRSKHAAHEAQNPQKTSKYISVPLKEFLQTYNLAGFSEKERSTGLGYEGVLHKRYIVFDDGRKRERRSFGRGMSMRPEINRTHRVQWGALQKVVWVFLGRDTLDSAFLEEVGYIKKPTRGQDEKGVLLSTYEGVDYGSLVRYVNVHSKTHRIVDA